MGKWIIPHTARLIAWWGFLVMDTSFRLWDFSRLQNLRRWLKRMRAFSGWWWKVYWGLGIKIPRNYFSKNVRTYLWPLPPTTAAFLNHDLPSPPFVSLLPNSFSGRVSVISEVPSIASSKHVFLRLYPVFSADIRYAAAAAVGFGARGADIPTRSEEHTSELQSQR